jgi:hypothetical protein
MLLSYIKAVSVLPPQKVAMLIALGCETKEIRP